MSTARHPRTLMFVNSHAYDDPNVMLKAASLVQNGYQVYVIGAARRQVGGLPFHGTSQGVEIFLTPVVMTYAPLAVLKALWSWIRGNPGDITEKPLRQRSNLISIIFFWLWLFRKGITFNADVIHCHDISPLPVAWLLAKIRRARLIYEARESAATFYTGIGLKGRVAVSVERLLISRADAVITVGDRLANSLREIGAKQVTVIGNWKRLEDFEVSPERLLARHQQLGLDSSDALIITYVGTLDPGRDLPQLLETVRQSQELVLLIGGRGLIQDQVMEAAETSNNIYWLGWVTMDDLPVYTQLADVLYSCINPDEFSQATFVAPNKLYEAFAAGKPLIARRGVGEMGEILEQIQAAVLLDNVTVESLKRAFEQLRDSDFLAALQREACRGRELYNWSVGERRLLQLYAELL